MHDYFFVFCFSFSFVEIRYSSTVAAVLFCSVRFEEVRAHKHNHIIFNTFDTKPINEYISTGQYFTHTESSVHSFAWRSMLFDISFACIFWMATKRQTKALWKKRVYNLHSKYDNQHKRHTKLREKKLCYKHLKIYALNS